MTWLFREWSYFVRSAKDVLERLTLCFGATLLLLGSAKAVKADELKLTPDWEFVSDQVMGGVSTGQVTQLDNGVTRLTGDVSLENNGGFVQMAFDLRPDGRGMDVSDWTGLKVTARGQGDGYEVRLRTERLNRPWQSYNLTLEVAEDWQSIKLPFAYFMPHRTEVQFDPTVLRRIGILAIGKEFAADVSVSEIALYR